MEPETSIHSIWPAGVPTSYWDIFDLESVTGVGRANFLQGLPDTQFSLTTLAGAVFIFLFARKMFNMASFDPEVTRFRVLAQLSPSQLRRRDLARRSYIQYAGVMILIFLSLTFFGEMIFSMLNAATETAGLQFNVSAIKFDSPSWPLTIAFGMIGLIPMLKPVDQVELYIRKWVHRRAGIPVKLHDRCNEVVKELDAMFPHEGRVDDRVPDWLHRAVQEPRAVARAMESFDHLVHLRDWLVDEMAHWPAAAERQDLLEVERRELAEARTTIDEFHTLLSAEWHPQKDGSEDLSDSDLHAHRNRLIEKWRSLSEAIAQHRDELVAILVVYAERDTDYAKIEDGRLEKLIRKIFEQKPLAAGPEYRIANFILPLSFVLYALAISQGLHPPFGNVGMSVVTVLITAALETLKVAILFVIPLGLIMSYRRMRHEDGKWIWVSPFRPRPDGERQMVRVVMIVLVAAILALLLLGLVWSVAISDTPQRLKRVFLTGDLPLALVYTTLAPIALVHCLIVLLETDADAAGDQVWTALPRWGWGLVSAGLVLLLLYAHLTSWMSLLLGSKWDLCRETTTWRTCVRTVSMLNFVLYPLIAFLSVAVLIPRPRRARGASIMPRVAAAAVIGVALWLVAPSPVSAQEADRISPENPTPIRVGFRADAEPFSYLVMREGDRRYSGFIADLCHKIFDGSTYQVLAGEIPATDRFGSLRMPGDPVASEEVSAEIAGRDRKFDLLCDPITLRYSLTDGREKGVFSPIIFVTGVSVINRKIGDGKKMTLAFVRNVSAEEVVARICLEDGYGLYRDEGERKAVVNAATTDAETDAVDWDAKAECVLPADPAASSAASAESVTCREPAGNYRLCAFASHTALIKWFCDGKRAEDGRTLAYVGDQDIIVGKLEAWQKKKHDCEGDFEVNPKVLTYEPYALVISRADPDLIAYVQRRIYEIFSHRAEAIGLFMTHFEGKSMSEPLANLYLINGVEPPQCLKVGHVGECPRYESAAPPPGTDAEVTADLATRR